MALIWTSAALVVIRSCKAILFRVRAYSFHKLLAKCAKDSSRDVKALIKDRLDDNEKLCPHSSKKQPSEKTDSKAGRSSMSICIYMKDDL